MQQTSLEAFESVNLGKKQNEVFIAVQLLAMRYGDSTNAEIAQHLGWPINRVTSRVHELRTKDTIPWIKCNGRRKCRVTHNNALCWLPSQSQRTTVFFKPSSHENHLSCPTKVRCDILGI